MLLTVFCLKRENKKFCTYSAFKLLRINLNFYFNLNLRNIFTSFDSCRFKENLLSLIKVIKQKTPNFMRAWKFVRRDFEQLKKEQPHHEKNRRIYGQRSLNDVANNAHHVPLCQGFDGKCLQHIADRHICGPTKEFDAENHHQRLQNSIGWNCRRRRFELKFPHSKP